MQIANPLKQGQLLKRVSMCVQLLPLMWLALLSLTLSLLAVLKWLLVNRVKASSYQKYSWAFQTKALNAAVQVCEPPSRLVSDRPVMARRQWSNLHYSGAWLCYAHVLRETCLCHRASLSL